MTTPTFLAGGCPLARARRSSQRGSALLLVMVILAILTMYAVANSVVLHHLRAEMRMIEQQQLQKFKAPTAQR